MFAHRNRDTSLRGIYLATLGSNARTRLTDGDWGPVVVDDYLLYLRGPTLMAQRLDVAERPIDRGIPSCCSRTSPGTTTAYMAASVSRTGTLAYAEPWPTSGELIWFSREGVRWDRPWHLWRTMSRLTLSPDGSRVAFSRVDPQTSTADLWLSDLTRGVTTRLTSDPMNDAGAIWSPDGKRILFRSNRAGYNDLFVKGADDGRPEEVFFEARATAK